jgi:hypothetical protein
VAFERSFRAAGRNYKMLDRNHSSKQDFILFIKSEIDDGRSVIELGIICFYQYRESVNK